jgi:predicted component of type VI protein secretion system
MCMYVCMDVCMYVSTCVCVCTCRMYVCSYVHKFVCIYVRMYVCMYVRTYVGTRQTVNPDQVFTAAALTVCILYALKLTAVLRSVQWQRTANNSIACSYLSFKHGAKSELE